MDDSVIAKSTGEQEEKDIEPQDAALFRHLSSGEKISKKEANYIEQTENNENGYACKKCKFNLPDEEICHIVEGKVNNDHGVSKFFSPKGEGMLPGDIVWDFVKKTGKKLNYENGYVIGKGAEGFQCKDCKYYLYSRRCLLINGEFEPQMSCGFIVKIGNGTEV